MSCGEEPTEIKGGTRITQSLSEKTVKVICNVEAKKVTVQVSEHWFQKQNKQIYKHINSNGSQSSLFEGRKQ